MKAPESADLTRVMSRTKAVYRSWTIPCAGPAVYRPRHHAEWLAKIVEPGVRLRAERLYQQLDALEPLRQGSRRDLLAESRKHDFTPRTKQVALALVASMRGDTESEAIVLSALRERNRAAKIERALEPEWLAGEILFELIHKGPIHSILVGGIAASINEKLEFRVRVFELAPGRLARF